MDRRTLLGTVAGLVGSAGLSGCLGPGAGTGSGSNPDSGADAPDRSTVVGADGTPSDICEKPAVPERIPAVLDPAFGDDWASYSDVPGLPYSAAVIGIERDGDARAYPISLLARFEIVNDRFDVPVLVTYCPLCSSGLTADRRIDGETTVFGNTSHVWRAPGATGRRAIDEGGVFGVSESGPGGHARAENDPNLVMYDHRTESYWSQLLAKAICGPLTGTRLTLVPSTVAEWGSWRADHPETTVLLPPPYSDTARRF